jgi:hypothetical protein
MLGLNVSATFNSAVTIYILIPLLMIPMMVLSGAMFSFDKLNRSVGSVDKVPLMAEIMVTKWSYEALMVHQYKDNKFDRYFYNFEKEISKANFKTVYTIPALQKRLDDCNEEYKATGKIDKTLNSFLVLKNEVIKEILNNDSLGIKNTGGIEPEKFGPKMANNFQAFLDKTNEYYSKMYNRAFEAKEKKTNLMLKQDADYFKYLKDSYSNENLEDMVRKVLQKEDNKILEYNHQLVQQYHPVFQDPVIESPFSLRTHFYAPEKPFLGKLYDTYWYNMCVIWLYTILLFITLYYETLKKGLDFLGNIKIRKETVE